MEIEMSNLIPFQANNNVMPAELASIFGGKTNLVAHDTLPALSIRGGKFRIVRNGEEKVLTTQNEDGDQVPVSSVELVVLGYGAKRSRTFYAGTYTEGSNASPDCHSMDGIRPDKDVETPCASSCEACPNSVKGSKVTEKGAATYACQQNQRLAVIPTGKLDFDALLLRLPPTSLWAKDSPAEANGWYLFDSFLKFIKANNVPHTAAISVKVRFDPDSTHPVCQFKVVGWLSPEQAKQIAHRIDSEEVNRILGKDKARTGDTPVIEAPVKEVVVKEPEAPKPTPKVEEPKKPAEDSFSFDETPAPAPKAKEPEAPKPVEEKPKAAAKKKPIIVEESDADSVGDLLADWS
jgi:hypothetical protein